MTATPDGLHANCPSHAWRQVHCDRCGREYQCTPSDDFYCAAEGDHCCEPCLLKGAGVPITTVVHAVPVKGVKA